MRARMRTSHVRVITRINYRCYNGMLIRTKQHCFWAIQKLRMVLNMDTFKNQDNTAQTCVSAHVPGETTLIGVRLEADVTLVRLLSSVKAHVLHERALQNRRVLADGTLKWSCTCKTRATNIYRVCKSIHFSPAQFKFMVCKVTLSTTRIDKAILICSERFMTNFVRTTS